MKTVDAYSGSGSATDFPKTTVATSDTVSMQADKIKTYTFPSSSEFKVGEVLAFTFDGGGSGTPGDTAFTIVFEFDIMNR